MQGYLEEVLDPDAHVSTAPFMNRIQQVGETWLESDKGGELLHGIQQVEKTGQGGVCTQGGACFLVDCCVWQRSCEL